jgi:membrane-associated phospholipid phosphatase
LKHWPVWLLPALAASAFIALYTTDDNRSLFIALNTLGPATSDWLWANITVLGDTLVAFVLCLPLWRRRPDLVWAFVFVALLGTAWVHGLKPFLDLGRPPAVLGDTVHVIGPAYKAHTFPSGHATTAFAIGGLFALGVRSWFWASVSFMVAVLAALSRSVVGVHWPLDILAGMFGGWLAAAAGIAIARRTLRFGSRVWVQWAIGIFLVICALALLFGYRRDYPQAQAFERLIAIGCLAAAALSFSPGARLKRASLGRHPDL